MNSFNHYAYGAIGAWLYAVVGGIDLDPARPGYKHIIMRPQPGGELTSATAELRSVYGPIRSAWTLENGTFAWRTTVPANTRATVYIAVADEAAVTEQGKPAREAAGVTFLRMENGRAVFGVESGTYTFASRIRSQHEPAAHHQQ